MEHGFPSVRLVELKPEEFQQYLDLFAKGSLGHATPPESVAEMASWQNKLGYKYFVVETAQAQNGIPNGQQIGACDIRIRGNKAYLFNQYVVSNARRFGFGTAILKELEKFAKANGAKFTEAYVYWKYWGQIKRIIKNGYKPKLFRPIKIEGKFHLIFGKRI